MELPVRVSSAGFVLDGESPPDATRRASARYDLDIDDHRSRIIDADLVEGADLVVVMTNQHARQVLALVPHAGPRTFTLKELVRLAADIEPRGDDEEPSAWLGRLHEHRPPSPHLGNGDNDIDDPFGRSDRVHRRVAAEVVGLVDQLLESMAGQREPTR